MTTAYAVTRRSRPSGARRLFCRTVGGRSAVAAGRVPVAGRPTVRLDCRLHGRRAHRRFRGRPHDRRPPGRPAAGEPRSPPCESIDAVADCIRCGHCCDSARAGRNTVPGEGNPQARLMLRRRGPGRHRRRRPAVPSWGGRASCSTAMLAAIELPRETVFIANVVKCRPPQNRKPLPDEIAACLPYLQAADPADPADGDRSRSAAPPPRDLLGVRKSLAELRNEGASFGRHSADRHVPPRGTAPKPELEEAHLG